MYSTVTRLNNSLFKRLTEHKNKNDPVCRFISVHLTTTKVQQIRNCKKLSQLTNSIVINQQHQSHNYHIKPIRFLHNHSHHSRPSIKMTNKTNKLFQQQPSNQNEVYIKKPFHTSTKTNQNAESNNTTIHQPTNFRSMASIQKLVTEPTREHIENIRHLLKRINAKDNNDQSITMVKDHETGIASVCIRSAAKNGISCKMMSDLLDIVDELYSWNEGKGVILYGHGGFFCSGN